LSSLRPLRPLRLRPVSGGIPPVYSGGARLLDWKNTARGGMTVDLGLRDAGPLALHPFKGMVCGKEYGQRMKMLARSRDALGNLTDIYSGEAILLRWSDDSVSGMAAKFLIDGGPDGSDGKHPFEGMIAGRKEGEPLELSTWAVADDERIQHPRHVRRRTPFSELNEVKQSQILCRDNRFISFLASRELDLVGTHVSPRPEEDPVEFAAVVVRRHLGIGTRAVLGHETVEAEAARRSWRILMNDYFRSRSVE